MQKQFELEYFVTSEVLKSLNSLLKENIPIHTLHDEMEAILKKIEQSGLSIIVAEPTRLFAFFEFSNGVITAHLYKRVNHLLIKNLIDKHNMRKRK